MSDYEFSFKLESGWHSTVVIYPELGIVLKVFREGFVKNAEKEFYFLQLLYDKGLNVPKPYALIKDKKKPILIREFIDGVPFNKFLLFASHEDIKRVVLKIIELAYKLDIEKIFLNELSRVTRNIIVTRELNPYIIDLERATKSQRSNVSQFLSYLYKLASSKSPFASKIREIIDADKIIKIGSLYKKKKDFNLVLECFKI